MPGLLNSRLLGMHLKAISSRFHAGYYAYNRQYIAQLPIRPIDFSDKTARTEHEAIVKLVEKIMAAKKSDLGLDTPAWEQEIDERVYRLYGLTKDEIAIVEGQNT